MSLYVPTFPMYALVHTDGSGPFTLSLAGSRVLTLFTEPDHAKSHAAAKNWGDLRLEELPTSEVAKAFVTNPPNLAHPERPCTQVVVNIHKDLEEIRTIFLIKEFLFILDRPT